MRCHACQVPRLSDSLLLDAVDNWCCSNHFSDLGVLDLIASGFVDGSPSHLAGGDLSFMSQQHATVSEGRIGSENFMSCHIEIEVADQTFFHPQSQYTDTGPTSQALIL